MAGMRIRRGTHWPLEEEADRLIKESLVDVTRHADKSDILTPWKLKDRLSREVYVASGTPEAHLRQGQFHRAYNRKSPHLNSRDGTAAGTGARIAMTPDIADEQSSQNPSLGWRDE